MTNAQIKQQNAIEAQEKGLLTSYESTFVDSIKEMSKKDLNNLTSKQYNLLTQIADKND